MKKRRRPTPATKFSEQANVLPRVEVFAAGNHRGKVYTRADLDQMVEAFERYSSGDRPLLEVPAVLGHDEKDEQHLLRQTSLPAAAWTRKLWREGDKLFAAFADVPPEVMRLIQGRRYKKVSAEVYDKHPGGLPTAGQPGRMLRRVAFLGGEIPQVKSLADIPVPHAESGSVFDTAELSVAPYRLVATSVIHRPEAESYVIFAEVVPMDETAGMLEKLQEHGLDGAALKNCPPEALAEMLRVLDSKDDEQETAEADAEEATPETPADPGEQTVTPASTPAPGEPEEKKPVEMGDLTITHDDDDEDDEGPAEPQEPGEGSPEKMAAYHRERAQYHSSKLEKYAGMCGKKMAEPTVPSDPAEAMDPTDPSRATTMSEKVDTKAVAAAQATLAALNKQIAETRRKAEQAEKFAEKRLEAERVAAIDAELDAAVKSGRLLPAQREARRKVLLALSPAKVVKFSDADGNEQTTSQLDLALEELRTGPEVFRFSERLKSPAGRKDAEDAEVRKVEEHYEQFAEQFGDYSKDALVEGFKKGREVDPSLTAAEFLGV
jgi:hypothetical protein